MTDCPAEDKTCRLCGLADQYNLNIFKIKDVYKKILSVYPIILYQSDPLPKNICHKCYGNVLNKYDEYQRINKIQQKWINNVKNNQANNLYIRMLDLIEEANTNIMNELTKLSPDFLKDSFQIIKFHQNFPLVSSQSSLNENPQCTTPTILQLARVNNSTQTTDFESISRINSNEISLLPSIKTYLKPRQCQEQYSQSNKNVQSNFGQIQKIQKQLASNGCTLMTLSGKKIVRRSLPLELSKNECRYCLKTFKNQKLLSVHQANKHLKVLVHKIFEKKLLPKIMRRAVQILVHNKNWLRCKNCLNIFGNRESIVNHWKMKRCGFFCKICGIDYPTDPKSLREHLINKHGITFTVAHNCNQTFSQLKRLNNNLRRRYFSNDTINNQNQIMPSNELMKENESNCEEDKVKILKFTQNSNLCTNEFDINMTNMQCHIKINQPALRVKSFSELQEQFNISTENFQSLSDLKLNTLNFDNNSSAE